MRVVRIVFFMAQFFWLLNVDIVTLFDPFKYLYSDVQGGLNMNSIASKAWAVTVELGTTVGLD